MMDAATFYRLFLAALILETAFLVDSASPFRPPSPVRPARLDSRSPSRTPVRRRGSSDSDSDRGSPSRSPSPLRSPSPDLEPREVHAAVASARSNLREAEADERRLEAAVASIEFGGRSFSVGRTTTENHLRSRMEHHLRRQNGGREVSRRAARAIRRILQRLAQRRRQLEEVRATVAYLRRRLRDLAEMRRRNQSGRDDALYKK